MKISVESRVSLYFCLLFCLYNRIDFHPDSFSHFPTIEGSFMQVTVLRFNNNGEQNNKQNLR